MIEEDEDDWYFNSIKRYEILNMFELEKNPNLLAFTNSQSVCLVSSCKSGYSELLELQLPSVGSSIEENTRDLKFKCGRLFENKISQIKVQFGKGRVIVSEEKINGITIYNLPDKSGSIEKTTHVKSPLISPRITIKSAESPHVFIAKYLKQDGFLIDVDAGTALQSVKFSLRNRSEPTGKLVPLFVERDLVAICHSTLGIVDLIDLRTNESCWCNSDVSYDGDHWTFDSKYNSKVQIAESHSQAGSELSMLSSNGNFMNFDLRNLAVPVLTYSVLLNTENPSNMQLNYNPNVDDVISLAGVDNNVYVYRITNDGIDRLFVHDGHSHIENCDKNSITVSHAWTDTNSIASCAENKTLHLWKYSTNTNSNSN